MQARGDVGHAAVSTKPPPFARQTFTADDLSPISPPPTGQFRDEILSARNGLFTPPGTRNTVQMPGNNGGARWSGAAVDPVKGWLYVVSKDLPAMLKLAKDPEQDKALAASAGERYYTGFGFMIASGGCRRSNRRGPRSRPTI
jgi:quinoprotein glucose dehydrogenase